MDEVESCLLARLEDASRSGRYRVVFDRLRRAASWEALEWQIVKRMIAESIAQCLSKHCNASVYLSDLHGGEFVYEELGNKDIDLIVVGCDHVDLELLERRLERAVHQFLEKLLGRDPYAALGIPNIVELHSDRELLGKKLLESRFAPLIRLA